LQEDKKLHQIEQQITKSVLKALKELAETDAERYATFWGEFGRVLKEGVASDWKNKDAVADLCRFESLKTDAGKLISLRDYVVAMGTEQKEIYYATGPNRRAIVDSPHLEAFRKRGLDVLLLSDPIDEWVVQSLLEFDKHPLKSVAHGEIDLGAEPDAPAEADVSAAVAAVKIALGDRVKDVRASRRLTESASCLVAAEGDPSANFERIMKILDRATKEAPRILELNAGHAIVKNLNKVASRDPESARVKQWAELLLEQALLAEGVVSDPARLVKQIQELLTEVSTAAAGS
jgi:molecular chaperone HtpG